MQKFKSMVISILLKEVETLLNTLNIIFQNKNSKVITIISEMDYKIRQFADSLVVISLELYLGKIINFISFQII
jgi:hypothetical protein